MIVTISPSALPGDSTKINIEHIYLCRSLKCKRISFRKSLHKVHGVSVCPKCGSGVDDITFSDLGQSFLQRAK
jgi:transcription initiation factor IIE alpha subunit